VRHTSGMTEPISHTDLCVELALMGIMDNNEATRCLEPGRLECTPETREEALAWLANGNASCYTPEDCA